MSEMLSLQRRIRKTSSGKGFHTPSGITPTISIPVTDGDVMLGKLALAMSELGEACEAVRDGDLENFGEELADTVIRVLDMAEATGISLYAIILRKIEKNEKRPKMHGRKTTL